MSADKSETATSEKIVAHRQHGAPTILDPEDVDVDEDDVVHSRDGVVHLKRGISPRKKAYPDKEGYE